MKETNKTAQAMKRIFDFTDRNWNSSLKHNYFSYLGLLYHKEQGKSDELRNFWQQNSTNTINQWYYAKVTGNRQKSLEIEKVLINDPRYKITLDVLNFVDQQGSRLKDQD